MPRCGAQTDGAAEQLGDDAMHDVHAQTCATAAHFGGEEGVEDARRDILWHANAVVCHDQLNVVGVVSTGLHTDVGLHARLKCVVDGVDDQIGEHLAIATGKAIAQQFWSQVGVHRALGTGERGV